MKYGRKIGARRRSPRKSLVSTRCDQYEPFDTSAGLRPEALQQSARNLGWLKQQPPSNERLRVGLRLGQRIRSELDCQFVIEEHSRKLVISMRTSSGYVATAALTFLHVSSSASGSTRLSPVTVMKLVSPT